MDALYIDVSEEDERNASAIVAGRPLPSAIKGFSVEFGTSWDGDPTIWVWLYLPSNRIMSSKQFSEYLDFVTEILSDLMRAFPAYAAIAKLGPETLQG